LKEGKRKPLETKRRGMPMKEGTLSKAHSEEGGVREKGAQGRGPLLGKKHRAGLQWKRGGTCRPRKGLTFSVGRGVS